MTFTSKDLRLVRRVAGAGLFLAAFIVLLIFPGMTFAKDSGDDATEGPIWSADMLVVEYNEDSIGAGSADLFSNQAGSADLQAKRLWYYRPDRELRLAFEQVVPGSEDLVLQIGGNEGIAFRAGSGSYTLEGIDDPGWEDGQTVAVRIVPASAAANTPATGAPTIGGTAKVNETLIANINAIADADGLTNVSYSYQWLTDDGNGDTDIDGETSSTYKVSDDDVGKTIKVRVTFTDDADNEESLTSAATAPVAATVPTEPLALTVSRGSQIRELDASWQTPSSNGGSAITGYKLQWKESAHNWDTAADVSEATATVPPHTITGLTGGVEYAVRVIATNDVGEGPASAEATGTPAGGTLQQNLGDKTSPTILSIAITSDTGDEDSTWDDDGVYGIGDRIEVTVTFNEDVIVTGLPQLELTIGSSGKNAAYKSTTGSEVVFSYTVAVGDSDTDGTSIVADKLKLNG